jgi:predicted dinucleotide-binding enzyme
MGIKVGVIGAGNVGGTLGGRWAQNGHDVMLSKREGSPTVAEVVQASDVLLLATPFEVTEEVLRSAGDLSGKIVIDATNPLLPKLAGLSVGTTLSGAELVAQWAPGARVVKAFNTVGWNIMANPAFPGGSPAMFYCGDDAGAKHTVAGLIAELGFEALDAGPLVQARVLEPFALLWISLAVKYGYGREIGFHFMRR